MISKQGYEGYEFFSFFFDRPLETFCLDSDSGGFGDGPIQVRASKNELTIEKGLNSGPRKRGIWRIPVICINKETMTAAKVSSVNPSRIEDGIVRRSIPPIGPVLS
jgi:hypothetical protein